MRTAHLPARSNSGAVLYYLLGITMVVGAALGAYLTLVSNENVSVQRSQSWNACIAVAEAGIEEAFAHINYSGLTNLASRGWSKDAGVYTLTRSVGDCSYRVRITSTDPPVIYSTGSVPLPLAPDQTIARTIETRTLRQNMFPKAIVAKEVIDLKGNDINVDSFISSDATYSTGGRYDRNKRRDHGDIATNSSITNSFNIGNANIAGRVSTGPKGSVKIGPKGTAGNLGWVDSGASGVQDGYFADDMNVAFPPVRQPYTSAVTPGGATVNGTTYDYVLASDNYLIPTVNNSTILVTGNATLLVTDALKISQGGIYIAPGASLRLYVSAASAVIAGNGIVNANASAASFYYFGLPGNTSLTLSGNGETTGAVYAPDADVTLGGGGTSALDYTGALMCRTLTMNGSYNIHYDEDLARNGPALLYLGASWNEL